jgi:hypothetical protein
MASAVAWKVAGIVSAAAQNKMNAMWKRLDENRADIEQVKVEQAVLKHAVASIPSHEAFSKEIHELEQKIERRIDKLWEQINQIVMSNFKGLS